MLAIATLISYNDIKFLGCDHNAYLTVKIKDPVGIIQK